MRGRSSAVDWQKGELWGWPLFDYLHVAGAGRFTLTTTSNSDLARRLRLGKSRLHLQFESRHLANNVFEVRLALNALHCDAVRIA
jgi:hypothetical protein